jgi:hypothetical protein
MSSKIDKYPILSILNGPMDFTHYKPTPYVGFSEPDGSQKMSPNYVWTVPEIKSFLRENMAEFRKNVTMPAESFIKAVEMSKESLRIAFEKDPDYMFKNLKYTTGVILRNNVAMFYKIDKEKRIMSTVSFVDDVLGLSRMNIGMYIDCAYTDVYKMYCPIGLSLDNIGGEFINSLVQMGDSTGLLVMFRSYADHELKVVMGKSTGKVNNVQYKNPNKQNVHVIDSSWYTSIIKTEGFLVKGHLRLQACGTGHSERKLIYIDSFEKHGYIRKAKMLPQETPSVSQLLN